MGKIKITQDQADAIEHLLKEHEGNKDEIMDIHCSEDFEWEETHAVIEELKPSQLARALYTGYEAEQTLSSRMKKFNVTVEWVVTKTVEVELENRFKVFNVLTHDIVDDDGRYLEGSFRIGSIHEVEKADLEYQNKRYREALESHPKDGRVNNKTAVNTSDFIEACKMVQEIVGDFVCVSNDSTQEITIANRLMKLQSLLLEMEESE